MAIGYAPGVFDLFHIGDLDLLTHARAACDHLVVAVATDALLDRVWGRTPFMPEAERMEIVAHLRPVDQVVPLDVLDLSRPQRTLGVTDIFIGGHLLGEDRPGEVELMLDDAGQLGLTVLELNSLRTSSSRVLRAALAGAPDAGRSVA